MAALGCHQTQRMACATKPAGRGFCRVSPRSTFSRRVHLTVNKASGADAGGEAPKGTFSFTGFFGGTGTRKVDSKAPPTGTLFFNRPKTEEKGGKRGSGDRDNGTVFVAGATGRSGARIVRELLQAGFAVRAGARDVKQAAKSLEVAVTYGILTPELAKRVTVVPFDLTKPDTFEAAIGNAAKVVSAVGAPESDALNASAPKKIDGEGSIALVNKAAELGVEQFIMVTSLGTGKLGWPAGVLNLFWGVLIWKREAEKALEASGMSYCIVRPGGMERPTDSFKKTHNLVLKPRDSTFGGLVSRLQVAELVAACAANQGLAENKVLEVVAETEAPLLSFEELLKGIKSEITKDAQAASREKVDAARAELSAAQAKFSAAQEVLKKADGRVGELSARLKEAKATETAIKKDVTGVLRDGASAEKAVEKAREAAKRAALEEQAAKVVLDRARKAASQGVLLSDKDLKAIVDEVLNPKPKPPAPAPAPAPAAAAAAAAAAKASGSNKVFAFFGKKEPAGPTPEELAAAAEAEAKAAAEAEAAARAKAAPKPLFSGFFGAPKPAEPTPAPAAAKTQAVPAAAAAKKQAAPAPAAAAAKKQAPAKPAAQPDVVVVEEPKPAFAVGNFFSGFMQRKEEEAQQAAAAAPAPAPAPQPALAAAAVAAAPAAAAAPASPKPAAPKPAPKPAAPAADSDEEERRRKVVEAAKAKLAASAAPAAPKAEPPAAPKPAPPAPKPEPVAEAPKPAAAAAAAPAPAPAAEAPKPKPAVSDYDADVAQRKAEAQAWIAAWKSRNEAASSPAGQMTKFLSNLFSS